MRERISRNVHIIRLSQNMTVKATIKPMTIPSELVRVVNVLLPEDVVAVAVAAAVGAAVGVAAGPIVSIVVSICVIDVIAGQTPLSEMHKLVSTITTFTMRKQQHGRTIVTSRLSRARHPQEVPLHLTHQLMIDGMLQIFDLTKTVLS